VNGLWKWDLDRGSREDRDRAC